MATSTEDIFPATSVLIDEPVATLPEGGSESGHATLTRRRATWRTVGWVAGSAGALLIAASVVMWPVFSSAFTADDVPNSQRTAFLAASGQSAWDYAMESTRIWVRDQGRFFPVSAIENVYMFDLIHDRALYKVLQVAIVLVVVALCGVFVAMLTRQPWSGVATAVLILPTLQIRHWFDAIIGFGVLLPSLAAKVLLTWILLLVGLRAKGPSVRYGSFVLAGALWTAALLQYEIVYLLAPLCLVIIWADTGTARLTKVVAGMSVLLPTLLLGLYVASLRSEATPSAAYAVRTAVDRVVPTLVDQLLGPVPFNVTHYGTNGATGIGASLGDSDVWTVLAVVLGAGLVIVAFRRCGNVSRRHTLALGTLGLGLGVLPALPIAVSAGRQDELVRGLAYLPVFLQGLGLGILACALVLVGRIALTGLQQRTRAPRLWRAVRWTPLLAVGVITGLGIGVAANGNRSAVALFMPLRHWNEAIDASITTGWMSSLPPNGVIVAREADDGGWMNPAYIAWRGGPADLRFVQRVPGGSAVCPGSTQFCDPATGRPLFHLRSVELPSGRFAFVFAPVLYIFEDPFDPLIDVAQVSVFSPSDEAPACPGARLSELQPASPDWVATECDGVPAASTITLAWFVR